jgi:beta-ureidopropionase
VGVYICYDRHFPEGARILGLNGAEIVLQFVGDGGTLGISLGAGTTGARGGPPIFRGGDQPSGRGEVLGHRRILRQSYLCDPRGKIVAQASRDKDELVVADLDLDLIREVRATWQFYRDRRPESYSETARTQTPGATQAAD